MDRKKKNLRLKHNKDETLGARRSSLQVNLSYVSNLSDSGNGSLKKSQLESTKGTVLDPIDRNQINRMADIIENTSSTMSVADGAVSNIKFKEQALNRSCQLLKDAILHKTREIFDGRAELAVKTATILKGGRQVLREINDDPQSINMPSRSSVSSKVNSMSITPTAKSTVANRITKSGAKSILDSVTRISRGDESVILSGSSKLHRKTLSRINDKVLKVRLTRIVDPRSEVSMESSQSTQSSQSSLLEDIGAPITCSSFISGHGNAESQASQRCESECRRNSEVSDAEEAAEPVKTLTPMEMTAVQAAVPLYEKDSMKLTESSRDPRTRLEISPEQSSLREVPMELTTVQTHIPIHGSSSSGNTVRTSLNVNTSITKSSIKSDVRISEEALATRTNSGTRISLHVNTSLGSQKRSSVPKTVDDNYEKIGSSMTKSTEHSVKDSVPDETDPMSNMTLIARLRNISGRNATETDDRRTASRINRSSTEGPSFVEGTPYPPCRSMLWTKLRPETLNAKENKTVQKASATVELDEKSSESSDSESGRSTEYLTPTKTTVVLSDSPCRYMASTGDTQIIPDSSDDNEPMDVAPPSTKFSETSSRDHPQILSTDLSQPLPTNLSQLSPKDLSSALPKEIPKNLFTEISSQFPERNKTPIMSRPGKKKLLPLYENLELASFSPISPALPSPKVPIVAKRKKNIQKRKAARDIAAKRIESMCQDVDDDHEPGCSIIDGIRREKAKLIKKKPRKIISKKIVVKKIVGIDVARELESLRRDSSDGESMMERNSLNDFASKKPVPILGQYTRSQKHVIVATGFSIGDADLVKRIVKELGGAEINAAVTRRTTHVVSTGVRTINLLRGIIRGCWLVSLEWVLKSLEKRKWLNAEQYEMVHFSKAVQENRRDRQLFGKAYVPELFATCGPIYIEHGTTPPSTILKELVKTAGGRIAENVKNSKVIVGSEGLKEIWILDSITTGSLQPIEDYKRRCRNEAMLNESKRTCLRGTQGVDFVYSMV